MRLKICIGLTLDRYFRSKSSFRYLAGIKRNRIEFILRNVLLIDLHSVPILDKKAAALCESRFDKVVSSDIEIDLFKKPVQNFLGVFIRCRKLNLFVKQQIRPILAYTSRHIERAPFLIEVLLTLVYLV